MRNREDDFLLVASHSADRDCHLSATLYRKTTIGVSDAPDLCALYMSVFIKVCVPCAVYPQQSESLTFAGSRIAWIQKGDGRIRTAE